MEFFSCEYVAYHCFWDKTVGLFSPGYIHMVIKDTKQMELLVKSFAIIIWVKNGMKDIIYGLRSGSIISPTVSILPCKIILCLIFWFI